MIVCPICAQPNHHLAVTCRKCGSFLQPRFENLDLFLTMGRLIESPFKTFHVIATARHKNFSYILAALSGWAVVFTFFWAIHAGEYASSFLNILLAGLITGICVGIPWSAVVASCLVIASRIWQARISFKNSIALTAYSSIPLILIFVALFPVIFLTFGRYFFTREPSPATLRPFSYHVIAGIHYGLCAWASVLFLIGIKVMAGASWKRTLAVWSTTLILIGILLYAFVSAFIP